ncbi:hypothetical protein V8C42DRAFT_316573 [Trichoderma barbatum]
MHSQVSSLLQNAVQRNQPNRQSIAVSCNLFTTHHSRSRLAEIDARRTGELVEPPTTTSRLPLRLLTPVHARLSIGSTGSFALLADYIARQRHAIGNTPHQFTNTYDAFLCFSSAVIDKA